MKIVEVTITKEYILRYLSEETIFERYLGFYPKLGTFYTNPLRKDEFPGCSFFVRNSDNRLIFNDHAWKQFDCIDVVMQFYSFRYKRALKAIAEDFNLIGGGTDNKAGDKAIVNVLNKAAIVSNSQIRVIRKPFTREEVKWWNKGGLVVTEKELIEDGIYSISQFAIFFNDEIVVERAKLRMAFAYHHGGYNYQLYFANEKEKKNKFRNSRGLKLGDLNKLQYDVNYVVITKSKKDCFFLRRFGVNAFYVINEKVILDPEFIAELRKTYAVIFTLFDNDYTGKKQSIVYKKKYKTIPLLFPEEEGKDVTEVLDSFGEMFMADLIQDLRERYDILCS